MGMGRREEELLRYWNSGKTSKEILADYPELEGEDITQALEYAAWTVSEKVLAVTA